VFVLDSLLVNGLRFVLDKEALAAAAEEDDEAGLRESLLEAQMRLEAGEIAEAEYGRLERDVLERLSDLRRRRSGGAPEALGSYRVTGAEVRVRDEGDE
jgi:hypothetical protein